MKIWTKALAVTAVTGALVVGGATAAQAVTVLPPEGGTWNYAPGYSDYYHSARTHKSTVCGLGCSYAPWTSPGYWATARVAVAFMGNTAFYDVK